MQVNVLDKGFVRLVDVMGNDQAIVQAARVSYGEGTKTVREDSALIDYLMRHQHTSPFEMVEFKFHVKAPIFVARQWFRHRTASVNEISARYSVIKDEFYVPEKFRKQSKVNKQASEGFLEEPDNSYSEDIYRYSVEKSFEHYNSLLKLGVSRELARAVLPVSTYTEFYWKQDLHNLLHFLKLRLSEDAQFEIREYAKAISEIVKEMVPITWKAFEEHVLFAKRFSKTEIEVLQQLVDVEKAKELLKEKGLSESRIREFLRKMKKDL